MSEPLHLLVPTAQGWRTHCGATPDQDGALIPLAYFSQYQDRLCPGCQGWPHPPGPLPTTEDSRKALQRTAPLAIVSGTQWTQDPTRMNKTEARYAVEVLGPALHARTILDWGYTVLTLRFAARVTYTPDFVVWRQGGGLDQGLHVDLVEIKGSKVTNGRVHGYWQGDAAVKFRLARASWRGGTVQAFCPRPQRFGGGWQELFKEDPTDGTP